MPKRVLIQVNEDGTTHTDYLHFMGASCLAEGERLHALLAQFGVQVEQAHVFPKPELLAAQQEEVATSVETSLESMEE
jgi:hypothetical protein